MSRIDEALRQAGRKAPAEPSSHDHPASLESFPQTSEPEAHEEQRPATVAIQPSPVVPLHQNLTAERLVTHGNTESVVVEQYRRLAGVLHHAQADRGVKVVMLASAQSAEGKTL